jgi:hypothetical protein
MCTALSVSFSARAQTHYAPPDLSAPKPSPLNRVELIGMGGYQFGGSVDLHEGSADFENGPTVGGILGVRVRGNALAIAGYHYQFSKVKITSGHEGDDDESFDMAIGYLQIGGEIEFPVHPRIKPFLGMTLGAVHFTPATEDAVTDWFFAGALFGGFKIPLSRHFGLRTNIKMLVTVLDNDSASLCVSGKGCVTEIDVNAMVQGEISGGAYLSF